MNASNGRLQARFEQGLALFDSGRVNEAIEIFESLRESDAGNPHFALNLAHAKAAAGKADRAAALYRELMSADDPAMVCAACWSLADLKGSFFGQEEIRLMLELDKRLGAHPQRHLLKFALGRAYEQQKQYGEAFSALEAANKQVAAERPFPAAAWRQFAASIQNIDRVPEPAVAPPGPAPIFIIGMPRSGSTLVEQILAAHSAVEATSELPFIENLARAMDRAGGFARALPLMNAEHCRQGAAAYLEMVEPMLTGSPLRFTDKWPDNFWYIGLVRALFPEARIVNVIRDPMDNAMGVFKQFFSHGNTHSSRFEWITDYWEIYLDVLEYWERLFPGAILHLGYTELAREPAPTIRMLLKYCGLEFEDGVLRFHETERAVMTPSGQQVRQPIHTKALGSSDPYLPFLEEWLPRFERIRTRAERLMGKAPGNACGDPGSSPG